MTYQRRSSLALDTTSVKRSFRRVWNRESPSRKVMSPHSRPRHPGRKPRGSPSIFLGPCLSRWPVMLRRKPDEAGERLGILGQISNLELAVLRAGTSTSHRRRMKNGSCETRGENVSRCLPVARRQKPMDGPPQDVASV